MNDELSPVKRALLEQRRLKARIGELERARTEPIAVIGVGCRVPGASGPVAFWQLLRDGMDAVSDMPASRWDVARCYDPDPEAPGKIATRFGGYLDGIDLFDPHAFGLSPREAETMDPQQRVLLEVAWEALQHAGCAPDRMAGSRTGVFVGIGPNDYFQQYALRGATTDIDAYLATGNAHSVASGRISYLLGLYGPAISLDTACSSSLVAIHLACEGIRAGSCDAALAGGVGILISEQNYISLSKARMMALDGRCKTFDARADGFVRSEGCGVVVLKRLRDAERDGDRVLAVIRGTACNQDGRSNGITAPNGPAQQAVIRAALANAGVSPSAVSYVEAHGTGTVLGDPIEVESLTAVLGEGRTVAQPLHVGSVKTNLGHLEAAAGVAGVIKTVLALHHGAIPANLHFQTPNPHINWDAHPYLRVPTALTPWDASAGPRTAGVSAFGFSGTNVHLVIEEAPARAPERQVTDRPLHVLALSAKTDAGMRAAAADLAGHLAAGAPVLADVCYSINTSRAALPHRVSVVASTTAEMRARLGDLAAARVSGHIRTGVAPEGVAPRVLFSFSASGIRNLRDLHVLLASQPAFAAAIAECDLLLRAGGKPGVVETVESTPAAAVVVVAAQYALAAMWRSWGVVPDGVLGDGIGHYAAGAFAGVFTLADALRLAGGVPAGAGASVPQMPVFSSVPGRRAMPSESADVALWARAAQPAQRASALAAADREGFSEVVEVGAVEWETLTSRLAELFVRGVAVDWRGFDRGCGRSRVDVPLSPWVRQRYWFTENAVPARELAVPVSAWDAANRAAARQAALMPVDVELGRYAELWTELDRFTTQAVARTIGEIGLFRSPGERHTVQSAMTVGGVLPAYRHLLSLWMKRLERAGMLARQGEAFVAVSPFASKARTDAPSASLITAATPTVLRDYLQRCDRQLAAIVTGRQGPLETLFPGGSFEAADFFYREWGLARYYNGVLVAAAESLLRTTGGRPLRVLEIGAGTGGTSSALVPIVAAAGTVGEYWFTDVSEHFFGRAEQAYAAYPFMRFQRFDLDADPRAQSIPTGYFDLVVAANAVHATRDLGRAIEHARSLLAPHGVLMLYEVTTHFDWFEMSIALIEGWQQHADDLRGETPLLTPAKWDRALRERGFDRVSWFPPEGSPAGVLGHHVILASAPSVTAAATTPMSPAPTVASALPPAPRREPAAASAPDSTQSLRDRLAVLTHGERKDTLQQIVLRQVVRVMRLRADAPPPGMNDRLMNIGMDSLMAVEMKKLLGKELEGAVVLPSTLIFDHPTISAIAIFVLASLGFESAAVRPVSGSAAPTARRQSDVAAIASLSDDEVEALLVKKIEGIKE